MQKISLIDKTVAEIVSKVWLEVLESLIIIYSIY